MRNKLFLAILTTVILLFSTSISVSAQNAVNNEYKEAIGEMLKLSGSMAAMDQIVPQMITMVKQTVSSVPDSFWDGFVTKYKSKLVDKVVELYTPIYAKYYSLDDMKQLIAFYQTPIGKKLGETTPKIMIEGMQIGQKIGMEIATELQNELKAGGYQ